jgi:MoxR-like ATPase
MQQPVRATDRAARARRLVENVERVILGKAHSIRLVVIGLLAGGHVLIEDIPGVGKSTLARALARSVSCRFRRIQFTPDLLPADITGIAVYDQEQGHFAFRPGPIFANIVLADEINRTTPRTQSALLEAMNVSMVTVDGVSHPLPEPFLVIATQNPLEFTGTYPLPESQLDRFLLRIRLDYPTPEEEKTILEHRRIEDPLDRLEAVLHPEEIVEMAEAVRQVTVDESVLEYITTISARTRSHPRLFAGASPRASLGLFRAAQASAFVDGRDYVMPDDVKGLAPSVLAHRLLVKGRARTGQAAATAADVVGEILESTRVPV